MLVDHPDRDAILAAAVELEKVLNLAKRATVSQAYSQGLRLATEAAIERLRSINDDSFSRNVDTQVLLDQMSKELFRLTSGPKDAAPGHCCCCSRSLAESSDRDCCSFCINELIPLYAALGRKFGVYAI